MAACLCLCLASTCDSEVGNVVKRLFLFDCCSLVFCHRLHLSSVYLGILFN